MQRSKLFRFLAASSLCLWSLPDVQACETEPCQIGIEVFEGDLVVVEGGVAGHHGLKFLIDTGSTHTIIDRRLAVGLNLTRGSGKVINLDKTATLPVIILPSLAMGCRVVTDLAVSVADLNYLRSSGARIDGILGLDVLGRSSFTIDFAHKRMVFDAKDELLNTVRMEAGTAALYVFMDVGEHSVKMIVDSGAPGTVMYEGQLRRFNADYRVLQATLGRSFGGAIKGEVAVLPRLRLGKQDLDRRAFLVRDPATKELRDVAGFLGLAALQATEIIFDFERGELRWAK